MNHKNFYIKTYGCQMNVYDSIKIQTLLKDHGFSPAINMDDADLIIFNTCHIREKASEKVYSELGKINSHDKKKVVIVAGCTAQAEGEEIFKRSSNVDIVVGPQSYHTLPVLIEKVKRKEKWVMNLDFCEDEKFSLIGTETTGNSSAFLTIQEGCDKFCHFCCVPYTRGAEFSRNPNDIYQEALTFVKNGVKEITLLGQNVSAYGFSEKNHDRLGELIKKLATIDGLSRIRYTTSHPIDMLNSGLINAHESEPKLMPFIHLPVQSGSDKILKTMNRKHTSDEYLRIIEKFRDARPDIAFSSDFIVGYPGETDADFKETIKLVKKVKYAQCYSFKYSPRPGTPAAAIEDQVPEKIKSERLEILQNLLREQQSEFNKSSIGKVFDVLFEKKGRNSGQIVGKSPYLQSVVVEADDKYIGQINKVKITDNLSNSIKGILL